MKDGVSVDQKILKEAEEPGDRGGSRTMMEGPLQADGVLPQGLAFA